MLKFLYILTLIIILVILGYAFFSFSDNSGADLSLVFDGPEEVAAGTAFKLNIEISNDSDQVLQDAKIIIDLPEGVVFIGKPARENILTKNIGNLGVGSLTVESFDLMITSFSNDNNKTIVAGVEYSPEFLGSRFEKSEQWQVKISDSALKLEVRAPSEIASGQEMQLKINYENISNFDFDALSLTIDYPSAFNYKNSTLDPDESNDHWSLGRLRGGSKNNFTVIGKLVGPDNSFFDFTVLLETEIEGEKYLIDKRDVRVAIQAAPLLLETTVNDVVDYVANLGESLKYSVVYRYLSDYTSDRPAIIKTKLESELFDLSTLKVDQGGEFNALDRTITWKIDRITDRSDRVGFEVRVKNDFSIKRLGDRNFELVADTQMDDGRHIVVNKSAVKVAGRVDLLVNAYFRDAASGVVNGGSFPPTVGQATEYTAHWLVTNYATDVRDVVLRAPLPAGVSFVKLIESSVSSKPSYDAEKNEIVWRIDRISATKGVISDPVKAIIQIQAVPQSDMIGNYMPLLGSTQLNAIDEFTLTALSATADGLDTSLPEDSTVIVGSGKVRQ